jgi:hypothetical protein
LNIPGNFESDAEKTANLAVTDSAESVTCSAPFVHISGGQAHRSGNDDQRLARLVQALQAAVAEAIGAGELGVARRLIDVLEEVGRVGWRTLSGGEPGGEP